MFGAIDAEKKPELSYKNSKDAFGNYSLDQYRRALKPNAKEMSEEGAGKLVLQ